MKVTLKRKQNMTSTPTIKINPRLEATFICMTLLQLRRNCGLPT